MWTIGRLTMYEEIGVSYSCLASRHCLIMFTDKLNVYRDWSRCPSQSYSEVLVRELAWILQVAMMMNASRFNLIAVT